MNKGKVSRDILGLTGASFLVSIFFYGFINVMANAAVLSYCNKVEIILTENREWEIGNIIQSTSFIAAVVIFVILFLFLVGERIEAAVKELQEKESLLQKEKEEFIRGLSHDIRTPLTSMVSYTEYIRAKETLEKKEIDEYLGMMQRKAQQMKSLTDQLLDGGVRKLENIEDGKLLMTQLADEWECTLENAFSCVVDVEKCPNFSGEFDIREMRRIFDNLASNVEKYADEKQEVWLRIFEKEKQLVIYQENHRKKEFLGVESRGIGLESVRKIAENYGGGLSSKVKGDIFSIEIIFRIL